MIASRKYPFALIPLLAAVALSVASIGPQGQSSSNGSSQVEGYRLVGCQGIVPGCGSTPPPTPSPTPTTPTSTSTSPMPTPTSPAVDPDEVVSDSSGSVAMFTPETALTDASVQDGSSGTSSTGDPSSVATDADAADNSPAAIEGDASPQGVFGTDSRVQVKDTTKYPWRAYVALNTSAGRCTGSLVAPDVVVTAAHCIVEDAGTVDPDWATGVTVWPGRNGRSTPYGHCGKKQLWAPRGWIDLKSMAYDWGVIKLNCSIGNTTGWFGYNGNSQTSGNIFGYPASKNPVWSMWGAGGTWKDDTSVLTTHTIDTSPGQSGSPMLTSGCGAYCVHAVHGGQHGPYNAGARVVTQNKAIQTINKAKKAK